MNENTENISVMVVGRETAEKRRLNDALNSRGMTFLTAENLDGVRQFALEECIDIALLDFETSSRNGFEMLQLLQDYCPVTQVLVLAREVSVEGAVEAMKRGACDVIRPPFEADRVCGLIREAWRRKKILRENRIFRQEMKRRTDEIDIIGQSVPMKRIFELAKKIGPSDASVLIQGETGVGKNVVAHLIHLESGRNGKPFVTADCSTIPAALFESELFGHHKGSFSGADKLKYGLVEVANDGTLFLDEIGEVPLNVQSKLLRVSETGTFRRVGGLRDLNVNVRVVAATNRPLAEMCDREEFRWDLLYRLQVVTIDVPPLRERVEDIPALATHFLQKFSGGAEPLVLAPETLDLMLRYSWPGNVRELRNIIERATILAEGRTIRPRDLRSELRNREDGFGGRKIRSSTGTFSIKRQEGQLIREALVFTDGNRRRASQLLGISERSLFRRLKENRFDS